MTRTSDTVPIHLQRCRTLGEDLLKLCAHQSPYTGRTHRLFPLPQAASVRPRFEPTATPPSRVTSRGCYRYANPPPHPRFVTYQPPRTRACRKAVSPSPIAQPLVIDPSGSPRLSPILVLFPLALMKTTCCNLQTSSDRHAGIPLINN